MTQVITTVGYGDITPAKTRGQVFVGLYVTVSFFVIAVLMSEMQTVVMGKVAAYKDSLAKDAARIANLRTSIEGESAPLPEATEQSPSQSSPSKSAVLKPEKPDPAPLLTSVAIFLGVAAVWATFYANYPGEGKSWAQATYMALITLTTVGFGAITPVTEGGMVLVPSSCSLEPPHLSTSSRPSRPSYSR